MAEYGTRANSTDIEYCYFCGYIVEPGEETVSVGLMGYFGHARCWRRIKKGMSKKDNRVAEEKFKNRKSKK